MNYLLVLFLLVGQWTPRGALPVSLAAGPFLSCTHSESTTNASLTTNGTTDWIMFNSSTTPDRKSGGGSVLSSYTKVGTFTEVVGDTAHQTARALTWTDGTPNASGSTNQGILNARTATNQGFSFTCPADTSSHRCIAYMGSYIGPSSLTVHLSDSSASDFTYTATATGGAGAETFNCQYKAGSSAQTVTFTWTANLSGSPGVSINGAAFQ